MVLKNPRLKKLLYYTTPDCLSRPALTEDQALELFGKNIKIVPKLEIDGNVKNYVFISFDGFTQNATNPEFRDNLIEIDILCPFNQWLLKDFELRPFKIASEIDSMLNQQRLTGIGKLHFVGAEKILENNEFGGLCLLYRAVHGEEDKKGAPNPDVNQDLINNFNAMFNN